MPAGGGRLPGSQASVCVCDHMGRVRREQRALHRHRSMPIEEFQGRIDHRSETATADSNDLAQQSDDVIRCETAWSSSQ